MYILENVLSKTYATTNATITTTTTNATTTINTTNATTTTNTTNGITQLIQLIQQVELFDEVHSKYSNLFGSS